MKFTLEDLILLSIASFLMGVGVTALVVQVSR